MFPGLGWAARAVAPAQLLAGHVSAVCHQQGAVKYWPLSNSLVSKPRLVACIVACIVAWVIAWVAWVAWVVASEIALQSSLSPPWLAASGVLLRKKILISDRGPPLFLSPAGDTCWPVSGLAPLHAAWAVCMVSLQGQSQGQRPCPLMLSGPVPPPGLGFSGFLGFTDLTTSRTQPSYSPA